MALVPGLRGLLAKGWFGGRRGNGFFLDEKTFRHELERERLRVDRNGSPLAVLTIELPVDRSEAADYDFLGRLLVRRLRITDTIGYLPGQRIGVLLPDTAKSGAWKVASDVCSVYPVGHDRPNCDVIVYPDDKGAHRDGSVPSDRESPEPIAPATFDALLVKPTPASKRAIDVISALMGLVVISPLLLAIAAAVKLTSTGPILYRQEREGVGGRRFQIYKFRTMRIDAEHLQSVLREFSEQDGPAFKMTDDPRITWVGKWLRLTSLDELPQLWNVLRGDMSLVGPRPLWTCESVQCLPWQRQRLCVVPGMTCIWQVEGRSQVSFNEWMRMDIQYIRDRSLVRDLQLVVMTIPSIVLSRGPR